MLNGLHDFAAGGVLEPAFLDLVRVLRFLFLVLDVAARQEHEVGANRPLLGRDVPDLLLERGAIQRPLARPQPFELEHDHLLAERVSFPIGRQLEPFERHLPGPGDLDEERVGCRQPGIAGTPVAPDHAVDHRIAWVQAERRQRQSARALPRARALRARRSSGIAPS